MGEILFGKFFYRKMKKSLIIQVFLRFHKLYIDNFLAKYYITVCIHKLMKKINIFLKVLTISCNFEIYMSNYILYSDKAFKDFIWYLALLQSVVNLQDILYHNINKSIWKSFSPKNIYVCIFKLKSFYYWYRFLHKYL